MTYKRKSIDTDVQLHTITGMQPVKQSVRYIYYNGSYWFQALCVLNIEYRDHRSHNLAPYLRKCPENLRMIAGVPGQAAPTWWIHRDGLRPMFGTSRKRTISHAINELERL